MFLESRLTFPVCHHFSQLITPYLKSDVTHSLGSFYSYTKSQQWSKLGEKKLQQQRRTELAVEEEDTDMEEDGAVH